MRIVYENNFIPAPEGLHHAVCVDVLDEGEIVSNFDGEEKRQHKVKLVWQLDQKMDDGRPFLVTRRYTKSLHPKSKLREHLESWRGRSFPDNVLKPPGFELESVIGARFQLQIIHRESTYQGAPSTFANVANVLPSAEDSLGSSPDSSYTRDKDRQKGDEPPEREKLDPSHVVEEPEGLDEAPF